MNIKNKIDFDKQLPKFYSTLDHTPLSSNAISMYLILLQIAFNADWRIWFKVANNVFVSKIKNLNISALQRARNELIYNQFILYKKRKKSKRSVYIFYC